LIERHKQDVDAGIRAPDGVVRGCPAGSRIGSARIERR